MQMQVRFSMRIASERDRILSAGIRLATATALALAALVELVRRFR
jgi:hypothetical protein